MPTTRPAPVPPEAAARLLSASRLAAAVRSAQATPEELREAIRRRPAQLRETLETVVADPARPPEMRAIAAVGLGSLPDGRSAGALLKAAASKDGALARRAIEALGRVGTPDTLARLRRLAPVPGAAQKTLDFARSLIAYRHGLEGERLALPRGARVTPVDRARAAALPVARLSSAAWAALKPALHGADTTVVPAARAPLEIRCARDRLLLFVHPMLEDGAPGPALARPMVAAVLMKWSPTLARWFLAEYIFSHPLRGGAAQLLGTRPTGGLVHTGRARTEGASLRVALQALDTPLAAPAQIDGLIGAAAPQGLRLDALVEPDRTRNRRAPRAPRLAAA